MVSEPARAPSTQSAPLRALAEGLGGLFALPVVWRLSVTAALTNLGLNMVNAVQLIFVYRVLHLPPGLVGTLLGVSATGSVAGALAGPSLTRRLGKGPAILAATLGLSTANLLLLAAPGHAAPLVLLVAWAVIAGSFPVFNANVVSIRQTLVPPELLGRINAGSRTLTWGAIPVGAVAGGFLGSHLGPEAAILAGAVVAVTAALPVLGAPFRLR